MYVIWLTGLSGSGKTTIAESLSDYFKINKINHEILDGDAYRAILSPNDGYSKEERDQFRRKIIFIAEVLIKNKIICIIPLLSSTRIIRDEARKKLKYFIEVYVKCPIEICAKRDPKGHYKKVKEGKLKNFVGIDIDYEESLNPEIIIESNNISVNESVEKIVKYISERKTNLFECQQ
jgi:adenylylsulfate kinase